MHKIFYLFFLLPALLQAAQGVFIPAALDLGSIAPDVKVKGEAKFYNKSDKTLQLLSVSSDCGCTVPALQVSSLEAGASTTLQMVFDSAGQSGPISRQIRLVTNNGTFTLPVKVHVNPFGDWIADTQMCFFPAAVASKQQEVTISFKTKDPQAKLLSCETPYKWLTTAISEVKEGHYTLSITRTPEAPVGVVQTALKLVTTSGTYSVPVLAHITGNLAIYPNPLSMGSGRVGQASQKSLVIEGWTAPNPPKLVLPQGKATLQGTSDGVLTYLISLKPESAGMLQLSLLVLDHDVALLEGGIVPNTAKVYAEIPVFLRALN